MHPHERGRVRQGIDDEVFSGVPKPDVNGRPYPSRRPAISCRIRLGRTGDGLVHAWIQDVMVAGSARRRRIGVALVEAARDGAREAGCEFLHVDFDDHLREFYFRACGFKPTNAGLIELTIR